jgi:hypothetical protein
VLDNSVDSGADLAESVRSENDVALDDNVNMSVMRKQEAILACSNKLSATMKNNGIMSVLLKLYLFGETVHLSVSQGTQLLQLMRSTFPGGTSDELPLSYETLQAKVNSCFYDQYVIKQTIIKFPSSFSSSGVIVYRGHYVDILTLLGDMMLDISAEDLHLEPLILRDSCNNRVVRVSASGVDFETMFEYVTNKYGQDVIALPITVALDELALNKTGSRGAKPTYIQIASHKVEKYWSAQNLRCIGYSPMTQVGDYVFYLIVCH